MASNIASTQKDIKVEFLLLDKVHKKMLIEKLDSSQRGYLLKIIKNQEHIKNPPKPGRLLKEIRKIKDITQKITRINDKRTIITIILRFIKSIIDSIALFFGIYTADKTNSLVTKALAVDSSIKSKLPTISENQLKDLINQTRLNQKQLNLVEYGFSPEISDMHFSSDFSFKNIKLEGIIFNNCTFDWSSFSESELSDISFKNCDILNINFCNARLQKCVFSNCEIQEGMFTAALIKDSAFIATSIVASSFEDTVMNTTTFGRVSMPGTHFLQAEITESSIIESNLQDTVFFGTKALFNMDEKSKKTASLTKPTSNILIVPEGRLITTPKAFMKLDQMANVLPLRLTVKAQKVTKENVNREVNEALSKIGNNDPEKLPIPQRLIQEILEFPEKYPNAHSILKKAEVLSKELDSFFLGGGEDIPPALYGEEQHPETNWDNDYRRTLLELGMIYNASNKGIPLMGVCRGFQMVNVYFGAHLTQNLKEHLGIQKFTLNQDEMLGLYANAFDGNLFSSVAHHQGVPLRAAADKYLEPVIIHEGLVKGSELKAGASTPMILLQFHPECYNAATADSLGREIVDTLLDVFMSKRNDKFWDILSDSAKTYKAKKEVTQEIKKRLTHEGSYAIEDIERIRDAIAQKYREEIFMNVHSKENQDLTVPKIQEVS